METYLLKCESIAIDFWVPPGVTQPPKKYNEFLSQDFINVHD